MATKIFPWYLYSYGWMPYPRRLTIYLREKNIPSSLITTIMLPDPRSKDPKPIDPSYPPKPEGSVPLLSIPQNEARTEFVNIGQSLAIMNFLEDMCDSGQEGFPKTPSMRGTPGDPLARARVLETLALADECTADWNPVRTFGTAAGPMELPQASKEMLRWVRRALMGIERQLQQRGDESPDALASLAQGGAGTVTLADIVLFQFLEFCDDCYGLDMSKGSGKVVTDVYFRQVKEDTPRLEQFYQAFRTRNSARRDPEMDEVPWEWARENMAKWHDGVLDA